MTKQNRYNQTGNFVTPEPRERRHEIVRIPDHKPPALPTGQHPIIVQATHKTSDVDRARGFNIRVRPLAAVTGIALAVAGFFLGLGLFAALVILVSTFAAVWLVAFVLDHRNAPENLARYNARRSWDIADRTNKAMVDAFRKANGLDD